MMTLVATPAPSAYRLDPRWATPREAGLSALYLAHTWQGDPLGDAAAAALSAAPRADQQRWFRLGLEAGPEAIPDAPPTLLALLAESAKVPDWFDPELAREGARGFHGNSQLFLVAFVTCLLIEGFSTPISKSFNLTGRLQEQGIRRLMENNRHLAEIFLPGGLDPYGDGWRLSVRIRLIHARIRLLLNASPEWDRAAWGEPLSAAHMGAATGAFSGLLLRKASELGARLTPRERLGVMMVWRRTAQLMGVPEALVMPDEEGARMMMRVARRCEPEPDLDCILLANALINSAPLVAGITDPAQRRALAAYIYRVARGMLGHELADTLRFPRRHRINIVPLLRLRSALDHWLGRMIPACGRHRRASGFQLLMSVSFFPEPTNPYRLPAQLHAERDRED
jgi:hypothetical protein